MVASNPARPLNCEVDIFRLAVRKKNGLRHELLGSKDGHYRQQEKLEHCFKSDSCPKTTSTASQPSNQLHFGFFFLSVFTCFTWLPPSGAVTWSWPTSGTAEADGVASHWATSSYTCLDHLRHIPGIHANHWATLSYACLSHLAIYVYM